MTTNQMSLDQVKRMAAKGVVVSCSCGARVHIAQGFGGECTRCGADYATYEDYQAQQKV